ncbi:MAG: Uma2 family endonuclease [Treponema sp.]|jgi:Uma2 family endonuclease|nr:Uma2 family endonuclease [Treponema sp.]
MALPEKINTANQGLVEPRFERIRGAEYAMGSPSYIHQAIILEIGAQLKKQLASHGCAVITAPFDVYPLYDQGDEETFVQPDIFTACEQPLLEENRYLGAPRFIVEVLSPTNRSYDMMTKYTLYMAAGVKEYWIIDPSDRLLYKSVLNSRNVYVPAEIEAKDAVAIDIFPGVEVDFTGIFDLPRLGGL